jgi:hypothetical protein
VKGCANGPNPICGASGFHEPNSCSATGCITRCTQCITNCTVCTVKSTCTLAVA